MLNIEMHSTDGSKPVMVSAEIISFVINLASMPSGINQFEIGPGMILRRASESEVQFFKRYCGNYLLNGPLTEFLSWEAEIPFKTLESLPMEQWRYFVIDHEDASLGAYHAQTGFDISDLPIEIGFSLTGMREKNGPRPNAVTGSNGHPRSFQNSGIHTLMDGFFISPTVEDLRFTRECLDLRCGLPAEALAGSAIRQLFQLHDLPKSSSMRFLAAFSILESMLTHAPKPSDPYDSVTRQVKQKMALLNNRFDRSIDYSIFIATPEKIWSKMYSYRSQIAHGGGDVISGDLQFLTSLDIATKFLLAALRRVIRIGIREPQLISDLRNC